MFCPEMFIINSNLKLLDHKLTIIGERTNTVPLTSLKYKEFGCN